MAHVFFCLEIRKDSPVEVNKRLQKTAEISFRLITFGIRRDFFSVVELLNKRERRRQNPKGKLAPILFRYIPRYAGGNKEVCPMAVIVKGRNTVVSPAVKAYVEKKIDKVTRQFKAVGDIQAVLKVENGKHIAEITVPAKGVIFRAQESTKDMYASIDLVVEKIERQVHKYKTKLMKRKYNNFREVPDAAGAEPEPAVKEDTEDFQIIRNKSFVMHPMTPDEAILQMNLLNHDFFMFYDPDFGGVSVVYRRKDGNYGLLAPTVE
jgi:putative sigma-54 modulation protein